MKYLKSADELLFESLLNESIVYYSPNLRAALEYLSSKNPIAKKLSEVEGQDPEVDLTFLDFGSEGYLSFQQMPKAIKMIKNVWPNATDADLDLKFDKETSDILFINDENNHNFTGVWKGNRNQIRIGKFIKKVLPNQFSDSEIENFVNLMKTAQTYRGEIEIVEGDDINFWYKSENYESLSGSLGGSCMKDSENLKLYTKNPDVCKMVILVRNNKLAGRALLWKLHSSSAVIPEWFLDRVYVCRDADYNTFKEEAQNRGWSFRYYNHNHDFTTVGYKSEVYERVKLSVKIRPGDYKTYPYLDTFKRFEPRTGMLYNDVYTKPGSILLTSVAGSFITTTSGFLRNLRDRLQPVPVIEKSGIN